MLLAIDTSGPFCSAALYDDKAHKLMAEMSEELGRGHAERLMPMIEELLAKVQLDWQAITRIAVVNGPGSFTGLRVGLATARGLALALKIPCTGVTQFEAFIESCREKRTENAIVGVVIDARREQLWMQCFKGDVPVLAPATLSSKEPLRQLTDHPDYLIGSGARLLQPLLGKEAEIINEAASPPIAAVARFAARQNADHNKPKTLYLRAPDAKPQVNALKPGSVA